MAHPAPVLVDHLRLARRDLDPRDLAQRLGMEGLAKARVGERDARRPLLGSRLPQHHAQVLAIGGGVGATADAHWWRRLPHKALLECLQVQFIDRTLPPKVQRIAALAVCADAAARTPAPLEVRHLGDQVGVQVVAEQVAAITLVVQKPSHRSASVEHTSQFVLVSAVLTRQ